MNIFNPNDRNSAQNPQSGGPNNSITRQVISAIFGRRALFYNSGLADVISPIVDCNLQFPLVKTVQYAVLNAPTQGTTWEFIFKPPADKHWIVFNLEMQVQTNLTLPNSYQVTVLMQPNNDINQFYTVASHVIGPNVHAVGVNILPAFTFPMIGGVRSEFFVFDTFPASDDKVHNYEVRGVPPVYVAPEGRMLAFAVNVPTGTVDVRIGYLELPSNQPFGSILNL